MREKRILLVPRDFKVLDFIGRFGWCNEKHLIQLLDMPIDKKSYQIIQNRVLKRLVEAKYLMRTKLQINEPAIITIAENGAEYLNCKKTNVKRCFLEHDMLVIDLYFSLLKNLEDDGEVETDRETRRDLGYCDLNERKMRIPDLLIRDQAIEVEISEKNKDRLKKILNQYIFNDSVKKVNYFVRDKNLAHKIHDLSKYNEKFDVYIFKDDITNFIKFDRSQQNLNQKYTSKPVGKIQEEDLEKYRKKEVKGM
ncbi:hypothetical protein [Anaerosinus massiliensis]|uniref:hypothetical protein n=1 Tax=Massilibacillus massiliensis TaxID=1806837 RepID=UPI000DA6283F|nr:hypothetical protein [Massilibacillus massiliensis]